METINLTKLEQSVIKNTDFIDIKLENLNPDFLVDNFSKDNILKNTKLRKEFNQLCKKPYLTIFIFTFNKDYRCGKISTEKLKKKLMTN